MNEQPLLSVLVPIYNHAPYLEACLESLRQDGYPNLELILIDDGSSDTSFDLAERWAQVHAGAFGRLELLRQSNQGINKTLNRALGLARGTFVAILASDDRSIPGRFAWQVACFGDRPELKVLYANGRHWFDDGLREQVHGPDMQALLRQDRATVLEYLRTQVPPLYIQSCLFKRELLMEIGGFDETILADDWALNIKIFSRLTSDDGFAFVNRDVFHYRHHATNAHRQLEGQLGRILEVIEHYTPPFQQSAFRARVYNDFAFRALQTKNVPKMLHFLYLSQRTQFRPLQLARFARRVTGAVFAKLLKARLPTEQV